MAGFYIHIPFCSSRCVYCAFYSTTALELRQRYVDAVCREVEIRGRSSTGERGNEKTTAFPRAESVLEPMCQRLPASTNTIYLGGGTPSQLTLAQLRQMFDAIYRYNKVGADAEVTIEVNPDDVTPEFVEGLHRLPVNRISMGAQTFDDERLRWLHRRHTSQQVAQAVARLRALGIRNVSIDLMYGFPGETLQQWMSDIDCALALDVEHISAYCLSIEPGTPLHRMNIQPPGEELQRQMYYALIDRLEAAGYEHYEISNFAKIITDSTSTRGAGGGLSFRSRHNSGYWSQTPYVGIGAAAHSYDLTTRSWNVSDIRRYIQGIEQGQRIFDYETLDADTRYNDLVATALRTREGIDLATLPQRYRDYLVRSARRYVSSGLLQLHDSRLSLTRHALFVSDMVMADLMMV